jgi:hypothetical protein
LKIKILFDEMLGKDPSVFFTFVAIFGFENGVNRFGKKVGEWV